MAYLSCSAGRTNFARTKIVRVTPDPHPSHLGNAKPRAKTFMAVPDNLGISFGMQPYFDLTRREKIPLAPMGVLAYGSAHA